MKRDPRAESKRSHEDLHRPAVVLCCLIALRDGVPMTVNEIADMYNRPARQVYRVLAHGETLFEAVESPFYVRKTMRYRLTMTGRTIAEAIK